MVPRAQYGVWTAAGTWLQRERGRKKFYLLRIEAVQLHGVPWVLLVHPCLGVV
jgi:hypothetical protein